jgi:hypothetical protein
MAARASDEEAALASELGWPEAALSRVARVALARAGGDARWRVALHDAACEQQAAARPLAQRAS